MKATVKEKLWTYEDYISGKIPPDVSEIINGKEVRRMPVGGFHGFLEGAVYRLLYSKLKDKFYIFVGEVGLLISRDPLILRGADIVVISKERMRDIPEGSIDIPPELIIEIVSPSDSAEYVQGKIKDYKTWGVFKQVWIYPKTKEIIVIDDKGVKLFSKDEEVELLEGVKFRLRDLLKEVGYESAG